MFRTLRQPRYAALGVLMIVVAIACVGAGTWQIARFEQKRHENDFLRANAHRPTASVASVLPLVGSGRAPSRNSVEFRAIRVAGTYDAAGQTLVRSRTLGDTAGYLVLTPLRTSGGALLVVRGFINQPTSGGTPLSPAPPRGRVSVTVRVQAAESRHDDAALLSGHQVESINPSEQALRLGTPVYNGYAQLESRQAGTAGLRALPAPSLSNPAGGALEPQHFAYIIQWYLFAMLALAAPFAMARAETKTRREDEFDARPAAPSPEKDLETDRAAKLFDRYGKVVR